MAFEGDYIKAFQELMQQTAYTLLNGLILSVILLLFGFILGRFVGKFVLKVLHEFEVDKILKNFTAMNFSFEQAISSFASFFVYLLAIVLALNQLGIGSFIFNIIALGIITIITLSMVLAIKDSVPNITAGFFIFHKRLFKKGDKIKIKGVTGIITEMNFIEVKIQTSKGDVIFMPNSLFIKEEVVKLKR